MSESRMEALAREGWTRKFTANEPRLSEAVALYEETGYEVHLEPFVTDAKPSDFPLVGTSCTSCYEGSENQYKIIFTRKKADSKVAPDELFD
ncbi:hypothetical protein [Desulfosarcina ovata]|uniref:Uncharacterized protein n=2 Tax=Desulfosarcina ovata TaxID=83564 RepID=A0A5K8AME9_9BACT|nr:hypothetical protein [Desulfosarcina ovata]BBO85754.1 hypothetical protein DSCO28_63200 [Desulfosarcina ovata subsp. sediminis]BBO92794.1 hypothetical protein DSCOOX_59740 [Desulfosarcina ovata subsp. ovata]